MSNKRRPSLDWARIKNALRLYGMRLHRPNLLVRRTRLSLDSQVWYVIMCARDVRVPKSMDSSPVRWSTPPCTEDVIDEIFRLEKRRHGK